ncbi:unnamed protein product [Cuscuta epithymum]|uniref:SWIM-type domain-containing protein n=1 Tax=Cuscuta epithymum TaxID=186058 RepID=A0AAV0G650_9ASTE|nr:unnamed protein product [Cuscuta epithymum]
MNYVVLIGLYGGCLRGTDAVRGVTELAMLFEDGREFKNAMIRYAVHKKTDISFVKNEPLRVQVKCGPTCPFGCTVSWERRYKCFQVKVLRPDHLCNSKFKLRVVGQKWLEDRFEDKVTENPCIGAVEFKSLVKAELKINISISMATRAVRGIQEKTKASFKDQFKRIRNYAEECLKSIPGSTVVVKTERVVPDGPSIFQRIYVCFGPVKKGFGEGCRKLIGVDGCFLKGQLKGEILTAVGRDANNQMYPIAWAVVEIENNSSWTWFLELLKQDLNIEEPEDWTIISDQQKGLANVIQDVFGGVEHRNCARHIHANWSKKHKGLVLKKLFWRVAKCTSEEELQVTLDELDKQDTQAGHDLRKYPMKLWCKAYFRTSVKCDSVDNNLCEAFNSTLLSCRSKPLIPMLEEMRVAMMKRIARKKKAVDKWAGNFGPLILKKLNKNIVASSGWHVDFNGDDGYEIKKGRHQFKVKLQGRSCSCRRWDVSGIPCAHAVCAILDHGQNPEDYLERSTNDEDIRAPLPKKMSGRPKKKRIREETEVPSGTQLSRKGRIMCCSVCKQEGHNRSSCPSNTQPAQKGLKRGPRGPRARGRGRGQGSASVTEDGGRGRNTTEMGSSVRGRGGIRGKNRKRPTERGFGIYNDPETGTTILNPGQRGETVLSGDGAPE